MRRGNPVLIPGDFSLMRAAAAALLISLPFAGAALASPAMTTMPVQMRQSPTAHSRVVQSIPAHAQIDVVDCGRHWCTASWRDISGFVPVNAVGASDAPLVDAAPPPPPPGPAVVIAPFGYGYGWRRHYHEW